MKSEYVPPTYEAKAFNCANCQVYARQNWFYMGVHENVDGYGHNRFDQRFRVSYCESCGFPTIWQENVLIFPNHATSEPPNHDLPDEIKYDYEEARNIANISPRGAAALLRLAIQKLCKHLGQPGKNINEDIKALVAAGLPCKVKEAMDSVRVIGNEAVHPGTIDIRDDRNTVNTLFKLINFIAQKTITEPREIDDLYLGLPESARNAIAQRDAD